MRFIEFAVDTRNRRTVDITDQVAAILDGVNEGLVNVFVPHATAGVAIMETGSGSEPDLLDALQALFPRDSRYRHAHGAEGHGADHIIPAFISPSVTIPARGGRLQLGTWQSVVLVDTNTDNPNRKVRVSLIEG